MRRLLEHAPIHLPSLSIAFVALVCFLGMAGVASPVHAFEVPADEVPAAESDAPKSGATGAEASPSDGSSADEEASQDGEVDDKQAAEESAGSASIGPAADGPKAMARPYLWVVDTTPRMFFCGTIHLPDRRVLVQPATVRAAVQASQLILTEIDLSSPDLEQAGRIMRLPRGHLLSRMLPKKLYDRTAAILAQSGAKIEDLENTKIWAVTFRLQFAKPAASGTSTEPVESMDAALCTQAKAAGKQVGALETMIEQLRIFDRLDLNEQIRMLDSSVTAIENAQQGKPSSLEELVEVYLNGDENALYRYLCADIDPNDNGSCCFMRKILDGRNRRMLDRVFARRRAAPDQTVFVAVGAGHYPGPQGILALLKRRGYRVRRVESTAELQVSPTTEPAVHVVPSTAPPPPVIYERFVPVNPNCRPRVRRPFFRFPFFGRRCR